LKVSPATVGAGEIIGKDACYSCELVAVVTGCYVLSGILTAARLLLLFSVPSAA